MNKSILIILFLTILGLSQVQAQRNITASIGIGTANYYGELTNNARPQFTRESATASLGYYLTSGLQFRLGLTHATIRGDDLQANDEGREIRAIHFRNRLIELSGVFIYEILPDKYYGGPYKTKQHFTPYLYAGFSLLKHNPQAIYRDNWYDLQPLGTEGQFIPGIEVDPYPLLQASIPLGVGLNYRFNQVMTIGLEMGYRKTFTDYLDDVSSVYPNQDLLMETNGEMATIFSKPSNYPFEEGFIRGNSETKDGFLTTQITFSVLLGSKK